MLISIKNILSLPVFTKSGIKLGKVININLDIDSHSIFQYVVGRGFADKNPLLIRPSQIIAITPDQVTVDDSWDKEAADSSNIKNIFSSSNLENVFSIKAD